MSSKAEEVLLTRGRSECGEAYYSRGARSIVV